MVRIPYGRLEFRLADSCCNPYLVIVAGLDGIERKLNPGEPHNFNHYTKSDAQLKELGIKILPQNLNEAMQALEADTLFSKSPGEAFVAEFIRLKRMEWVDYHRHVSDWEVKHYLEFV